MTTKLPCINMFGGPGSGKSTASALIFGKLKQLGYNVELAREFVKEKVWEGSLSVLSDQLYILGKQNHKLHVLEGQCDAAITDAPLINSLVYNTRELKCLDAIILEAFHQYDNMNYVVERNPKYNPSGRTQSEDEAKKIDLITTGLLNQHGIPYETIPYGDEGVMIVVQNFVKWFEAKRVREETEIALAQLQKHIEHHPMREEE